jgi:4-hydroxy-tetrahydrodipicolinate synthase
VDFHRPYQCRNTMARPQRHLNAEETGKVDAILKSVGLLG